MRKTMMLAAASALALATAALPAVAGDISHPPMRPSQQGAQLNDGQPAFPQGLAGQNLLNMHGDVVGTIKRAEGQQIVVGVGSYLGMGEHDIVLDRDEVNLTENGAATTPLSITDLQKKPAYNAKTTIPGGQSGDRFAPR
jgi:hypothetical protein